MTHWVVWSAIPLWAADQDRQIGQEEGQGLFKKLHVCVLEGNGEVGGEKQGGAATMSMWKPDSGGWGWWGCTHTLAPWGTRHSPDIVTCDDPLAGVRRDADRAVEWWLKAGPLRSH